MKVYKIIDKAYVLSRTWTRARYKNHIHWRIKDWKICPEKHRVYHVTESFYLPSRFMLHNFEETEWPSNLVHIDFFVNFTSDGVELYVNGCLKYISRKRIYLWIFCWTTNQFPTTVAVIPRTKVSQFRLSLVLRIGPTNSLC